MFLERELERRGDETERLHQIVAGLTRATAELAARLPELKAPSELPQSPEMTTVDTEEAEPPRPSTTTDRERGSWWRRMFGG